MAAPGRGAAGSADENTKAHPSDSTSLPVLQDFARLDHLVEAEVRALWWRMRRHHGVELPPERGTIVIPGGRS